MFAPGQNFIILGQFVIRGREQMSICCTFYCLSKAITLCQIVSNWLHCFNIFEAFGISSKVSSLLFYLMKCSNIFEESKLLMRVKWKFLHLFRYCSESAFKHNNPNTPDEMLRQFPTQENQKHFDKPESKIQVLPIECLALIDPT